MEFECISPLMKIEDLVIPLNSPSQIEPVVDRRVLQLSSPVAMEPICNPLRPSFMEPASVANGTDFTCAGDFVIGSEASELSRISVSHGACDVHFSLSEMCTVEDPLPPLDALRNWSLYPTVPTSVQSTNTTKTPSKSPLREIRSETITTIQNEEGTQGKRVSTPRTDSVPPDVLSLMTPTLSIAQAGLLANGCDKSDKILSEPGRDGTDRVEAPRSLGKRMPARSADDLVLFALQSLQRAEATVRHCGGRSGVMAYARADKGDMEPLLPRSAGWKAPDQIAGSPTGRPQGAAADVHSLRYNTAAAAAAAIATALSADRSSHRPSEQSSPDQHTQGLRPESLDSVNRRLDLRRPSFLRRRPSFVGPPDLRRLARPLVSRIVTPRLSPASPFPCCQI
jgi:hypothetical protein